MNTRTALEPKREAVTRSTEKHPAYGAGAILMPSYPTPVKALVSSKGISLSSGRCQGFLIFATGRSFVCFSGLSLGMAILRFNESAGV